MAVGDIWKLDIRATIFNQRIQNTLYFKTKTTGTRSLAECQALADAFKNQWRTGQVDDLVYTTWQMHEVYSANVVYDTTLCRRQGGLLWDGPLSGTLSGALTTTPNPPQFAMVTTLLTGLAGRSRRGRLYTAGSDQPAISDGKWTTSAVNAWQALWTTLLTAYGVTGTDTLWQWMQWSETIALGCRPGTAHPHQLTRYASPQPQTAASAVTSCKVRDVVYTQRRRTVGVGA